MTAQPFAEFFRVLRPGGAAVVSTQHPVVDWLRSTEPGFLILRLLKLPTSSPRQRAGS